MEIGNGKTGVSRNQSWHLVRIGVAGLLLTASSLKCWQLATEPVIGTSLLDSRWLLMATVELELLFGLWLMANVWAKPTWAAALACFGLFTCVSLCKALSGYASCGCFGRVQVNPWYTGTLDLAIVFSLLRWRPSPASPLPPGAGEGGGPAVSFSIRRATAVLVIWFLIGIPAALAMGSYRPATLADAGDIIGGGKIVVLEPEKWVGKRFPLLGYIDIGDTLQEGNWIVVLYHRDCPKCREVIKNLRQIIRESGVHNAVLIEMTPYGNPTKTDLVECQVVCGRLSDTFQWFAKAPIILTLQSGRSRPNGLCIPTHKRG